MPRFIGGVIEMSQKVYHIMTLREYDCTVLYRAHLQVSVGDAEAVQVVHCPQDLVYEGTRILFSVAPLGYDTVEKLSSRHPAVQ